MLDLSFTSSSACGGAALLSLPPILQVYSYVQFVLCFGGATAIEYDNKYSRTLAHTLSSSSQWWSPTQLQI